MKRKSLLIPFVLLGLVVAASPLTSFAQGPAQRIATANPGRILAEMQETKDYNEALEAERVRLIAMVKEKRDELQKLQQQRNQLKPESPQWDELNNKLMDEAMNVEMMGQQTKLKSDRNKKRQIKVLFQRIEQAVGEIAQRDGYDIVIADQRRQLPDDLDQVPYEKVVDSIIDRNVLYTAPKNDISDAVIALLDSKYKTRGGGGAGAGNPAAPAPAPAKKTAPAPK